MPPITACSAIDAGCGNQEVRRDAQFVLGHWRFRLVGSHLRQSTVADSSRKRDALGGIEQNSTTITNLLGLHFEMMMQLCSLSHPMSGSGPV